MKTQTDTPQVSVLNVTKLYFPDIQALSSVSLNIYPGDLTLLTGSSGAGKTTLFRIIAGFEAVSSGVVDVYGQPLANLPVAMTRKYRQKLSFIFQDFKLFDRMTVAENVSLPLEARYASAAAIRLKVTKLLEYLRLDTKLDLQTDTLSRGEQQRIAIARALITDPDIILADEPTGSLDDRSANRVIELLLERQRKGASILVSTHDARVTEAFSAAKILHLSHGRLTSSEDTDA